ncbi:MAG: hypothetical protein IJS14_04545 [Lentisphaeria bacterium]|nr:hypothetical protein [Lentisphaeria bacterium]
MITERAMLRALKTKIETGNLFREVRILGNEVISPRLLNELPELTLFPACLLAAGDVATENNGCTTRTPIEVVVISSCYGGDADLDAADEVLAQTMSLLKCDLYSEVLSIDGVYYVFEQRERLHFNPQHVAWKLRLTAKTLNI